MSSSEVELDQRIELAHRMATDQLAAQAAAIDELRARVGVVLSGASVATGFLAGQALDTRHGIPLSAWVATLAALALVAACGVLLWPGEWEGFSVDARAVLADVDAQPERTYGDYLRHMTSLVAAAVTVNDGRLGWRYKLFSAALVFLVVDFAGWIWTLAGN